MHDSGALKLVAPAVDAAWGDDKKMRPLVYQSDSAELPDWIIEIRNELAKDNLPVFTYFGGPELELYADGRVLFGSINDLKKDLLMKVNPKTIKAFLTDLKKTGFYQWSVADLNPGVCGDFGACHTFGMVFMARQGTQVKRMVFQIASPNKLEPLDKNWLDVQRMAKLKILVDKYFPTQKLRCGLGNSEQKNKLAMNERVNGSQ